MFQTSERHSFLPQQRVKMNKRTKQCPITAHATGKSQINNRCSTHACKSGDKGELRSKLKSGDTPKGRFTKPICTCRNQQPRSCWELPRFASHFNWSAPGAHGHIIRGRGANLSTAGYNRELTEMHRGLGEPRAEAHDGCSPNGHAKGRQQGGSQVINDTRNIHAGRKRTNDEAQK